MHYQFDTFLFLFFPTLSNYQQSRGILATCAPQTEQCAAFGPQWMSTSERGRRIMKTLAAKEGTGCSRGVLPKSQYALLFPKTGSRPKTLDTSPLGGKSWCFCRVSSNCLDWINSTACSAHPYLSFKLKKKRTIAQIHGHGHLWFSFVAYKRDFAKLLLRFCHNPKWHLLVPDTNCGLKLDRNSLWFACFARRTAKNMFQIVFALLTYYGECRPLKTALWNQGQRQQCWKCF